MKLFQVVQKNFGFLGLSSNQSCWNVKSVIAFSIFSSATVLGTLFLFFNANTFLEYTINIYGTTTMFGIWMNLITMLIEKENLFKLIDDIEELVDESEYNKNILYALPWIAKSNWTKNSLEILLILKWLHNSVKYSTKLKFY